MISDLQPILVERAQACHEVAQALAYAAEHTQSEQLRANFREYEKVLEHCCREVEDLIAEIAASTNKVGSATPPLRRRISTLWDALIGTDDVTLHQDALACLDHVQTLYQANFDAAEPDRINALFAHQFLQIQQCRAELEQNAPTAAKNTESSES